MLSETPSGYLADVMRGRILQLGDITNGIEDGTLEEDLVNLLPKDEEY